MTIADTKLASPAVTPIRVNDFRLAPAVLHYTDVADPHAMGETRAHGFDHGFLGCKAHCQKTRRAPLAPESLELCRQQQTLDKMLTKPIECALHPIKPDDIRPDAEDHRNRASIISRFISITAVDKPSKIDRAMIA
jgi:hypothetical protein